MRLGDLAIPELTVAPVEASVEIGSVTADSRAVARGALFVALKGSRADGAAFVADAVGKGAAAILAASDVELTERLSVPVLRAADPRRVLALVAARLDPGQPAHLVAVTGTSGKTSVAAFTRQIFEAAGKKAASVGTIGIVKPSGLQPGNLTTPDPVRLHAILSGLAREGITHAALEASSHGLDQRRLDGLRIEAAGFTNLGRDHLDYHPDVESYLTAKLRLFEALLPRDGAAVVHADDEVSERVVAVARRRGQRLIRTGKAGDEIRVKDMVAEAGGQRLKLELFGRPAEVLLPLLGGFQASNALVAAGLAIGAGIEPGSAIAALAHLAGAPGRLELVGRSAKGAPIFIDYAHKPEAITHALGALRPLATGRLVIVIGAGGDRDVGKRPLMGKAASALADVVIVTDDNPRSEDAAKIRAAVLAGAPGAVEIGDRKAAIAAAIKWLEAGDVLCIAGKGHETGQIVGTTVLPFSDHQVVAELIGGAR